MLSTPAAGATAAGVAGTPAAGSGAEAAPAGEPAGAADEAALPTGSVAGSPVAEHSREVLAEDDDLVDPDVADPDLVEAELDSGTRTDLGLPPQPAAATPAEAAAAASTPAAALTPPADEDEPADRPADVAAAEQGLAGDVPDPDDGDTEPVPMGSADDGPDDVEPVETGSEATVTIPTGDPPGRPVTFGPADQFGPTVALTPLDGSPDRAGGATRVGAPSRAGDPGQVGEAAYAGDRGRAGDGTRADAPRDGETVWLGDTARTGDAARTGEATRTGDVRPGDARPGDARPGDARPGDSAREWAGDRAGTAARTAYGAYGGADSEKPTQMIAPLPFGGAQGTLSEQQPARAFRAQPPTPVLGFPQESPRGDRRRTIGALLIVIALVAVVGLGGVLLVRSLRGRDDGGGTAAPTGAASTLGPAKVPAGFTLFEGSGFSVAVPAAWPTVDKHNGVIDAKEPTSTRFIRLITVDSQATAFAQLSAAEKQFDASPAYGAYKRVSLQRVDYRGLDAADWEFTFTLEGTPRHVLYRGIVTGGRTYGLYLSTPETEWAKTKAVFQVAADTFRTS